MLEAIKALQPGEVLWDKADKASVKGLHVVADQFGRKTFKIFYRAKNGQQRKPKIGEFGDVTLHEARRRAKLIMDRVAVGDDPKGQWDKEKAEMTVQELYDKCWVTFWNTKRHHESGHARSVSGLYKRDIAPTFANCKLSTVTPIRIREWHKSFKTKGIATTGNRALQAFSRMFQIAEELEIRNQHSNPCRLVKAHPEQSRKRFATEEEIIKIGKILERELPHYPAAVTFLYLLMFSGSRPRAIERATWEDLKEYNVNGQHYGVLTFHGKSSAKTGDEEKVILPPQAMKALSRLPRIEGCTITGMKMPRRLWTRIKNETGCSDLWARDWRRTFATLGNSNGISMGIIGELLNHRSTETTKIYAKVMDNKRIDAVTTIADRLSAIMEDKGASA